ncbi:hypothetical protein DRP04_03590 [Archaeoglobales archaeon]|nr:MAG: hypothetical protein DRP04_03590 [Archaeoglobales archaeon]
MDVEEFEERLKVFPTKFDEGVDFERVFLRIPIELDQARRLVYYEVRKVYGKKWWDEGGEEFIKINSLTKFDIVVTTLARDYMSELSMLPECYKDISSLITTRSRLERLVLFEKKLNTFNLPFNAPKVVRISILKEAIGPYVEYAYHPFNFSFNIKYCYMRFLQEFFLTPRGFKLVFSDWYEDIKNRIENLMDEARKLKEEIARMPEDPLKALLDYMKENKVIDLTGLNEVDIASELGLAIDELRHTIKRAHILGYIEMVEPFKFKLKED